MNELINLIKKIATDAVAASQPDTIIFGMVTKINPLVIQINEKLILKEGSKLLIIPKYLKTIDRLIQPPPTDPPTPPIFYINPGDKVMLIRTHNGNKYILMDVV